MKIARSVLILLIFCQYSYAGENIRVDAVDYSSFDKGKNVVISGSGFGQRADNGGEKSYLPLLWDDFESASFTNWMFRGDGSSWEISSSPFRANSSYCAHKKNEGALDSMQIRPSSQSHYYTSFWFYLPSNLPTGNNNKYFRAGSTSSNTNLIWNSNSNSANYQTTVEFAVGGTEVNAGSLSKASSLGNWSFIEIMWALPVLGSNDDYVKIYANGVLVNSLLSSGGLWPSGEEMINSPYISIGTWFSTTLGIGDGFYYDDVYIDYTQARIMLGNSPDFTLSSHREMQIPTEWADNSISITANPGSFNTGDTAYLYVIDADGNVSNNGQGVEITIGGGAGGNPSVAITSPTTEPTYILNTSAAEEQIVISGTADDDDAVVGVTWSNSKGGSGSAANISGNWATWELSPVTVQKGETVTTTVTVEDTGGQKSSDQIAIISPIVWSATEQLDDPDWKDSVVRYCVRLLVEGSSVTESANEVVLGFQGRTDSDYTIRKVSIAERDIAASVGDVVDSTWKKVTFDSTAWISNITVPANSEKLSDPVQFNLEAGKDYYVTFKIDSPSVYLNPPIGYEELYFQVDDHTDDIDWSANGHLKGQDFHGFSRIYLHSRALSGASPPSNPAIHLLLLKGGQ